MDKIITFKVKNRERGFMMLSTEIWEYANVQCSITSLYKVEVVDSGENITLNFSKESDCQVVFSMLKKFMYGNI